MSDVTCVCPEEVNVPITGITVPFCGFGVTIDAGKLPKCECDLSREELMEIIDGLTRDFDEKLAAVERKAEMPAYDLCEFYYFRKPAVRSGFRTAQGDLISDAAILYPEAWAYLQTEEGQALCVTEAEWQAMNTAVWHTNADGTKVGWEGTGGVPYYVADIDAGTLRLPDLRGMYAEAAGFDALGVGGVHGDAERKLLGQAGSTVHSNNSAGGGALTMTTIGSAGPTNPTNPNLYQYYIDLDSSRVVPVANKNQPRAWGALACVYLGQPAS